MPASGSLLTPLAPDLWELDYPHRVIGMHFGRRLTVVRLPSGTLWVHASLPPTPELRAALVDLGPVAHIVGPNTFHDAYLEAFTAAYPAAEFSAAPGLASANRRLRPTHTLGSTPPAAWATTLDQHLVAGMPRLNEVVFLHRASRTLIIADLCFNLQPPKPWFTRAAMRLNGAFGHFGPSRMFKSMIKDTAALRASIDHLLTWDFDRIVVGHGANLPTGGKAALRAAFAFLPSAQARV